MKTETNILSKVEVRPFSETDSLEELTNLLNVAYKKLADKGFKYVASYQDVQTTKRRLEKGQCLVAELDSKIVGTITYYPPGVSSGHEWYTQSVAGYGQFAVYPSLQNLGLGGYLIDFVEKLAVKDQAEELTINTAEKADELVGFYSKRGYRFVGYVQWEETNYRSVLLSKRI